MTLHIFFIASYFHSPSPVHLLTKKAFRMPKNVFNTDKHLEKGYAKQDKSLIFLW